jgi:hypothetical protein
MLNNFHVWVFVKWELKELKLGVQDHKFRVFEKKFRIKESMPVLIILKNLTELLGFTKIRKRGAMQALGRLF